MNRILAGDVYYNRSVLVSQKILNWRRKIIISLQHLFAKKEIVVRQVVGRGGLCFIAWLGTQKSSTAINRHSVSNFDASTLRKILNLQRKKKE